MHNVDYYKINSVVSPSYSVTKTMKFIKCSYSGYYIHVQDTIANLNTMCINKPSYSVIKTILPLSNTTIAHVVLENSLVLCLTCNT